MKDFAGTPGTVTGLVLRISQFMFAAGAIASMATTSSFFNFTAFWVWDGSLKLILPLQLSHSFHGFASDLELKPGIDGCLCPCKEKSAP